ncbi:MAG: BamA/TamA family outer membrane protein [Paludibacteraceae bacterium]|nr:BamA/TamA family outer membrane protein [Paludibacteraceae bacterium]
MKKHILLSFLLFLFFCFNAFAEETVSLQNDSIKLVSDTIPAKKIKKGWTFGALPSVAFDADLGFQGGLLGNVYYYGDGSIYPEYIHNFYVEAAYTTKHGGIFRFFYDSKFLIPNHRLTIDASYLPDAMCDFYGFNGYQSIYNQTWHKWKKDPTKMDTTSYQSRALYKYKRDLIRVAADIEGNISGFWKWNVGVGVLGYLLDECNIDMLNGKNEYNPTLSHQKAMNPETKSLYEKYIDWGLIRENERKGGWHPYVHAGFTYDSRDKRANPSRGIYTDAFLSYSAAFKSKAFGNQAEYNNLRFNFNFRHYVPIYKDRVTFAYRIGTQNLLAGKSPFYANTYLQTLFLQRVLYEGLGGGNSLRGIMRNRINADGYLFANIELRAKVCHFDIGKQHFYIGVNPFFDFGMITQGINLGNVEELKSKIIDGGDILDDYFNFDKKTLYRPHMSAGLGLKIAMNENFILSVDWAAALDKQDGKLSNFYIKMGYLF